MSVTRRLVSVLVLAGASSHCIGSSTSLGPGGTDGGPPPAVEDCLDGNDEDKNGKTDCEEPSCAPYARCTLGPAGYPGWTGYATVAVGDTCPAELPVGEKAWARDEAQLACPTCECKPQDICPPQVDVGESAFASCNSGLSFAVSTACSAVLPLNASQIARYWTYVAYPVGSCAAANVSPPPPAPTYNAVTVCTGTRLGGGCSGGQVCAPITATGLCLSRSTETGLRECPDGFPVLRLTVPKSADPKAAFADKRACTACTCDAKPKGGACTASLELFSDSSCAKSAGVVPPQKCTDVSCGGLCGSAKLTIAPTGTATCGASGGEATGSVELAVPGTQFCCDR